MASKEMTEKIDAAAADLIEVCKLDVDKMGVDYGQDGCRIESPDGPPPFGYERYKPAEFLTALQFAKSVVEAGK